MTWEKAVCIFFGHVIHAALAENKSTVILDKKNWVGHIFKEITVSLTSSISFSIASTLSEMVSHPQLWHLKIKRDFLAQERNYFLQSNYNLVEVNIMGKRPN